MVSKTFSTHGVFVSFNSENCTRNGREKFKIVRTFSGDESFETESPASENSGEMKRRECVWIS